MRIDTYSIVKLHKNKYLPEHITESDKTPRLLVIKTHSDTAQSMVRYPDGFISRVEWQDITNKSIFTWEHKDYASLLKDMPAAMVEWNKGSTLVPYIEAKLPQLALDMQQKVEARNQAKQKQHTTPTLSVPIVVPPVLPEETITRSEFTTLMQGIGGINDKLQRLIDLWGGKY